MNELTQISRSRHKSGWRALAVGEGESGQALVVFAVFAMAMMGMLAIGVDLALVVGGQRRFDQNGADAAALAVGHKLARSVAPLNSDGSLAYFKVPDEEVYQLAREYAGLQPDTANWSSAVPTGTNQSVGLTTRNHLAVTLEYWGTQEWGATWCYSPSGPMPQRVGGMGMCSLPTINGEIRPPRPATNLPFKVRVTVSSTANGFFSHVIGQGNGAPSAPAATDNATPACIRPQSGTKVGTSWHWSPLTLDQAPGRTICAHAVVVVSAAETQALGQDIVPVTTADCRVGNDTGSIFELWGSNTVRCTVQEVTGPQTYEYRFNQWNSYLDLSPDRFWCDAPPPNYGTTANVDYQYFGLVTSAARSASISAGGGCTAINQSPNADEWNRTGGGYVEDAAATAAGIGRVSSGVDLQYWISAIFRGTIKVDSAPGAKDGAWLPTYISSKTNQAGNLGNNIGSGFYCTSGTTASSCTSNASGTYFFAKFRPDGVTPTPGYQNTCDDSWGRAPHFLGCRDASVITWAANPTACVANPASAACDGPQQWQTATDTWRTLLPGGSPNDPERVRAARVLNFRFYCRHVGDDPNNLCTRSPSVGTCPGNVSSVCGQFISVAVPGSGTGSTPSIGANVVNME